MRGLVAGVRVGASAIPLALRTLWTTPRVKRLLVPPFLLTLVAFIALFVWVKGWMSELLGRVREGELDGLPFRGWARDALEWFVQTSIVAWMATVTPWLVSLVIASVVVLWAFSIVYEAIAGPFLDELHGRMEKRWFGVNPRDQISRPTELPASVCARLSFGAGLVSAVAAAVWWFSDAAWAPWVLALGVPLPFVLAGLVHREYGKWLRWVVRIEAGTLWVSIKASVLAGLILVLFFPLKFAPLVGYPLFSAVAGFTTALSLLDIPFSRRQWPLGMRWRFLVRNLAAMITFGCVASLLFIIPLIGPALMVPAASVGGVWLMCRLDKSFLRPRASDAAHAASPAPAASPAFAPAPGTAPSDAEAGDGARGDELSALEPPHKAVGELGQTSGRRSQDEPRDGAEPPPGPRSGADTPGAPAQP